MPRNGKYTFFCVTWHTIAPLQYVRMSILEIYQVTLNVDPFILKQLDVMILKDLVHTNIIVKNKTNCIYSPL